MGTNSGGAVNNRSTVVLFAILSVTSTCGGSSSASGNPNTSAVTFADVYSDTLSGICLPCHAPGGTGNSAGKLDMSTQALAYTNLQMRAGGASCKASGLKLVVAGDAAMSLLVEKVASAQPPCGAQMPYGCGGPGPCLSPAQVQEIADWINSGAKNE
jgi:cytochrome c553